MEDAIQKIQFKRGTKSALTARLTHTVLGVLEQGEPAFETDTGQLKIGDGATDYAELEYIGAGGGSFDPRFEITDPTTGQILVYDSDKKKWVNKMPSYEHIADEIISGKVYHVMWSKKPTENNTVKGIATDPDTGKTLEVENAKGIKSFSKVVVEKATISNSEIDDLFK